ncbi:MAG: D-alanine-D-alanine ligase [Parcubacteria group bacterium Greene1014_15]|nr:MAG: D-alanine-D-alanine ligase [Parcubacteria group bacterium Greene1014_15]
MKNMFDISLATGKSVLDNLLDEKYVPIDIVVHNNGSWHVGGIEQKPEQVFAKIDILWNALHGNFGEDGKLQRYLDMHGIPYTGSGALASALGMHKHLAKDLFIKHGIKTPVSTLIRPEEDMLLRARDVWRTFPHPSVVKPASAGSSMGISVINTYDALVDAILQARLFSDVIMIEEYIEGREATCGVINNFRGQSTYALPPVEVILPKEKTFYDFDAKYVNFCRDICPGRFSNAEKHELQETAKIAHDLLALRHYSRADFIVSPKRGIYLLEINTLPSLTKKSLMLHALEAVGMSPQQFLEHIIALAATV